jgi:CheY-like chemotaxis protein
MSHGRAQRVLVVDDHPHVAMCFRLYLDTLPHCEVVTALSGLEALRLFSEGRFDVLVTDRMMPEMNGVMLAERVRQLYPGTVMIMVTAFMGDAMADPRARDLFEQILEKPVDMEVLRGVVVEALERGCQAIGDPGGFNGDPSRVDQGPQVKGGMPSQLETNPGECKCSECSAGF